MGGEKILHSLSGFSASGSPPRGRGKEDWQGDLHNRQRITPAWAGKSAAVDAAAAAARDHPRVGGEKQTLKGTAPGRPGSPPRGRGKVCAGELGHHTVRTRTRFFTRKGSGTFFVYRKFCGRTTRNGKQERTKAGYHHGGCALPFALRNQVRFVRTWLSPYMTHWGNRCVRAYRESVYTSGKV